MRAPARRAAVVLHERRLGRRHRGAAHPPWRPADRALRGLLRHPRRRRVRAPLPGAPGADDPRLPGGGARARLAGARDADRRPAGTADDLQHRVRRRGGAPRPGPHAARRAAASRPDPPRRAPRRPARAGLRRCGPPARHARVQRPQPVVHAPDPAGGTRGDRRQPRAARAAEGQPLRNRRRRRRRRTDQRLQPCHLRGDDVRGRVARVGPDRPTGDTPQPGSQRGRVDPGVRVRAV